MSNLSTSARTVLVGAVLLVAVVGGTLFIGGGQPVTPSDAPPTASATPESPTVGPTMGPTVTFTAEFRSEAFGYDARRPIDWRATPGTTQGSADDLALGGHDGPNPFWDQFAPPGQPIMIGGLLATSSAVPPGVSEDDWIDAYQAPQIATLGRACIPQRSTWENVTVDGRDGGIYVGCQFVEAMVFADGRAYVFYYVNTQAAQSGVETTGRALLEAFLDTVSLEPDSARPASPAASEVE